MMPGRLPNRLQKLQIRESLMQNSIINSLFVVVAWHHEKIKGYETDNKPPGNTALHRHYACQPGVQQQGRKQ